MRILFDSKDTKFKSKFGTLCENEGCTLNIHIPKSCLTKTVRVIFNRENNDPFCVYYMQKTSEYDEYEVYSCDISFASSGLLFYYFDIETQNERFALYKYGYDMTNMEDGELWQLSVVPLGGFAHGDFSGKVMYQIFPDRFAIDGECNTKNKLTPFSLHTNLSDTPNYLPDEKGIVQNNDFFGGNLRGIISKLDYLKELKVGIIYLNPIFKAYSNHRYDTADYMTIDEMLGTEEDFSLLCDEAHKRGIYIILDGVFSHTGSNSIYFDSEHIFGNGAVSNDRSPYRSWFDFQSYPDKYTSWWGIKTLPCVNENDEKYRDFIIRDEDSVVAHWLKLGADGFRLDVADELPDSFILELKKRMREIKYKSFLIGEVWEDASNKCSYGVRRKYFTDAELDSVMNYPFRNAIIDFVSRKDNGYGFKETVMSIAENYPQAVLNSLMNILSTHDTVRILTALGAENVPADKSERAVFRLSETEYEDAKQKLFVAAFLQFVLPGCPCIYYGDEIGMQGFEDPFCRMFFEWSKINNNDILDYYKELTSLKNEYSALGAGSISVEVISSGVIKLVRSFAFHVFTAYINVSGSDFETDFVGKEVFSKNCDTVGNKKLIKNYGFILLR